MSSREIEIIDVWVSPFSEDKIEMWKKNDSYMHGTKILTKGRNMFKGIDDLLQEMDQNGVQKAILSGSQHDYIYTSNDWIAEQVRKYPDRLYGCAAANPKKGMEAVREFERAIKELGLIGLRLNPYAHGYPPNHNIYYPLYAKCVELNVPVALQVGHTAPMFPSEPGRPIYLDEVALFFPELTIIGSHIGYPWTEEMIALAWKHPNVYIDTTMHVPKHFPKEFVHYMKTYGQDKVLYGTSWPICSMERALRELEDLQLEDHIKRKFLHDNAVRAWKLK
jgi:hypothetical protein